MYVVPEEERAASTIETKPFEERQSFEVKAKTSRGSIQRRSVTRLPKAPTILANVMSS
jgi:hypothetical protein